MVKALTPTTYTCHALWGMSLVSQRVMLCHRDIMLLTFDSERVRRRARH